MKKIRVILLAAIFAFSAFATVACGEIIPPEDVGRSTILKVSILNDATERAAMSAFRAGFYESQPDIGIKVEYLQGGGAYYSGIAADYSGGVLADIIWTAGDKHSTLSNSKVFQSLNDYIDAEDAASHAVDPEAPNYLDDFYPELIASTKLAGDNSIYFLPRDYNKIVLVYNKATFDAAGVECPTDDWTWEDFIDAAQELRKAMDKNLNSSLGLGADCFPIDGNLSWEPLAYTMLRGLGGDVFQNGASSYANAFGTDTSGAEAYFETIKDLTTNRLAGIDTIGQGGLFGKKKAAMGFYVRTSVASFANSRLNFNVVSFPQMQENVVGAGCSGYAISSTSANKDAAWEFLRYIASVEGQQVFGATGAGVPVRISMKDDASWADYQPASVTGTFNNAAYVADMENSISVNFYNELPVRLHQDALVKFKEAVQAAEEYTSSGGYGNKNKDVKAWLTSVERDMQELFTSIMG